MFEKIVIVLIPVFLNIIINRTTRTNLIEDLSGLFKKTRPPVDKETKSESGNPPSKKGSGGDKNYTIKLRLQFHTIFLGIATNCLLAIILIDYGLIPQIAITENMNLSSALFSFSLGMIIDTFIRLFFIQRKL